MGKIRIKTLGLDEIEKKQKQDAKKRKIIKQEKKEKIRPVGGKGGERMKQIEVSKEEQEKLKKAEKILKDEDKKTDKKKPPAIKVKLTGKKYFEAKKKIDKNKAYPIKQAVELIQKVSFTKFDSSLELHLVLKENDIKGEVKLPHSIGKTTRVAIVDDKVIDKIEKGKIDFDILVARPDDMKKLVKYAKILGPKGLMPNPKAGTISDHLEQVVKKFEQGNVKFQSEKKTPLIHQLIGKLSAKPEILAENIIAFIKAVNQSKIKTAYIAGTMTPSVKLDLDSI